MTAQPIASSLRTGVAIITDNEATALDLFAAMARAAATAQRLERHHRTYPDLRTIRSDAYLERLALEEQAERAARNLATWLATADDAGCTLLAPVAIPYADVPDAD